MICNAIVLKNWFPKKNKVTVFHQQFGKINFYVNETQQASRLCNGSIIFCDIKKKESSYQCDVVDIYFIPLNQEQYDIYFIHDILKICFNFAPWHMAMSDVFGLIIEIYETLEDLSEQQKKIYLLKLFLYIGIFPEDKMLYQIVMQKNRSDIQNLDQILYNGLNYCWASDQT